MLTHLEKSDLQSGPLCVKHVPPEFTSNVNVIIHMYQNERFFSFTKWVGAYELKRKKKKSAHRKGFHLFP